MDEDSDDDDVPARAFSAEMLTAWYSAMADAPYPETPKGNDIPSVFPR